MAKLNTPRARTASDPCPESFDSYIDVCAHTTAASVFRLPLVAVRDIPTPKVRGGKKEIRVVQNVEIFKTDRVLTRCLGTCVL